MSSHSLHVASWNVDGLGPRLRGAEGRPSLGEVAAVLRCPDVLCLQEIRLRERDADDLRAAERALPGWAFVHSLANDPKNASFRGGRTYGVATYVRETLAPSAIPRALWDREGRVVVVVIEPMHLAIVNVYAVNGTDKAYWDHEQGAFAGDRHGFKRRMHDQLAALGRELRQRGLDLLLIGDFNVSQERIDITPRLRTEEPHATSRAHFRTSVVEGLDVVDVFRARNPEARAYTWFNRHARRLDAARVDFALLSRSRMDDVLDATIDEHLVATLGSDHAPLRLELARRQAR